MSGPSITGPLHRTNTFRSCLDADVGQLWNVATNAAMQALPYPQEGDVCSVITSAGIVHWKAVATGKIAHSATCLAGQNGIDWECINTGSGNLFKAHSLAEMQAITTAKEGDLCMVSLSTSDDLWTFVLATKYDLGANCLTSSSAGLRCLYPIDKLTGTATLVNGHADVYLPGIDVGSIAKTWYVSLTGNPGTLTAHMVTNGVSLDSNSGTDGSTVGYEVTLLQ
jgi:hypothetical protein